MVVKIAMAAAVAVRVVVSGGLEGGGVRWDGGSGGFGGVVVVVEEKRAEGEKIVAMWERFVWMVFGWGWVLCGWLVGLFILIFLFGDFKRFSLSLTVTRGSTKVSIVFLFFIFWSINGVYV